MKLLITGASPLLGINLALEAMREHEVYGVDRGKLKSPPFPVSKANFFDSNAFVPELDAVKPDWVINCAALANLDECEKHPVTLAQAPWSFKLLWSPSMDRYPPPFLGRKRGWILVSQVAFTALGLWLAGVSDHPEAVWVIGSLALATAIASATQDIACDAYTVEVLRPEEHGLAVGARMAFYRAAMLISGGVSITWAAEAGWPFVNAMMALGYLPMMLVTWFAPEPETLPEPPRTMKDAVWGPFEGFLAQHRAIELLLFVVLYKLSDNLTQALTRPFLVLVGFNDFDVGVAPPRSGRAPSSPARSSAVSSPSGSASAGRCGCSASAACARSASNPTSRPSPSLGSRPRRSNRRPTSRSLAARASFRAADPNKTANVTSGADASTRVSCSSGDIRGYSRIRAVRARTA